ncbi:hypothetical protein FS749_003273 [Ceratobasidium sp. UAMH 11750]|nr:hypothetical protein FS749_003273 [Ceratobasidium sp. UAMH 11750]
MSTQVPDTRLPPEIILAVLECSLVCETWEARAIQLNRVLLLSRTIYERLVKTAYSSVILGSINAASRFYDTLKAAPHLSQHVENIWIATPQLRPFDNWGHPFKLVETKVEHILNATKNIKRVAIPYAYFPRAGLPSVTHLTTTNHIFPPVTSFLHHLESLHIYGVPTQHCVNTVLTRFGNVRRVSIRVPPALEDPGALSILCARTTMLFQGQLKNMAKLELVVDEGVARILKGGMKKTLEEDPRIYICERGRGPDAEVLYDPWLGYHTW